jgi:hypothetical protein
MPASARFRRMKAMPSPSGHRRHPRNRPVNPKLDLKRIRNAVAGFAKALDKPELWSDIEDVFKKRPKKSRRAKE